MTVAEVSDYICKSKMKIFLCGLALCLALTAATADEEKQDDQEVHWARAVRILVQHPNQATGEDGTGTLPDELVNVFKGRSKNAKKLEERYPFNPLGGMKIDTPATMDQYWNSAMATTTRADNPGSIWYKINEGKTDSKTPEPISKVFERAIADAAKVIEEYQKSAVSTLCYNYTLGDADESLDVRKNHMILTIGFVEGCLEDQEKLLESIVSDYKSNKHSLTPQFLSKIVHNVTLIAEDNTDSAAELVILAALAKDEECFKQFEELGVDPGNSTNLRRTYREMRHAIDENSVTAEAIKEAHDKVKNDLDSYLQKLLLRLSKQVGSLHPETGTTCGKNLLKSTVQAAIELDMYFQGIWIDKSVDLTRDLFKAAN